MNDNTQKRIDRIIEKICKDIEDAPTHEMKLELIRALASLLSARASF